MASWSRRPAAKNRLATSLIALVLLFALLTLVGGCDRCKALCRKSYRCLSETHRKGLVEDVAIKRCVEACSKDQKERGGRVPLIEDALSNACE